MRLLFAATAATFVYLAASWMLGRLPQIAIRRRNNHDGRDLTQEQLHQAGIHITPTQYRLIVTGAVIAAFLLGLVIWKAWHLAILPALFTVIWIQTTLSRRRHRRVLAIRQAWPDGIRLVLAHLKEKLPVAVRELARTGPQPLREILEPYDSLVRLYDFPTALSIIKEDVAEPTTDKVLTIMSLAHDAGASQIPDILRDVLDDIVRDLEVHEHIRTQRLEREIERFFSILGPWLIMAIIVRTAPSYRDFYTSPRGRGFVILGLIWTAVGWAILKRVSTLPEEPRVLAASTTAAATPSQPGSATEDGAV